MPSIYRLMLVACCRRKSSSNGGGHHIRAEFDVDNLHLEQHLHMTGAKRDAKRESPGDWAGQVCFEILVIYLYLLAPDFSHLSR